MICDESVPSAAAVALPRGTGTKLQHVPVQLTRLPTTVDQMRSTGAFGVSPVAVTFVFARIWPLDEASSAVASLSGARLAAESVVLASIVGLTLAGHSVLGARFALPFVSVNFSRWLSVHGTGDCSMFR